MLFNIPAKIYYVNGLLGSTIAQLNTTRQVQYLSKGASPKYNRSFIRNISEGSAQTVQVPTQYKQNQQQYNKFEETSHQFNFSDATQFLQRELQNQQQQNISENIMKKTFYKRQLPQPPAIAFASQQGKEIFKEALQEGNMEGYFKLSEQFRTQDEPAYCGLTSLAMVLNALNVDPKRIWKGGWRWFTESLLDCCRSLEQVKVDGINLEQAQCLTKCNGADAKMYRQDQVSVDQFRQMIRESCSQLHFQYLIVTYSRKQFLQTGDGHFSPIGGYNKKRDLALIMDVAAFKYPPHWVKIEELYQAMTFRDTSTNLPRGFLVIRQTEKSSSVLFTLDVTNRQSQNVYEYLNSEFPRILQECTQSYVSFNDLMHKLVRKMPVEDLVQIIIIRNTCKSKGEVVQQEDEQSKIQGICNSKSKNQGEQCQNIVSPYQSCTVTDKIQKQILHELRNTQMYLELTKVFNQLYSIRNEDENKFCGDIQNQTQSSVQKQDDRNHMLDKFKENYVIERLTMLLLVKSPQIYDIVFQSQKQNNKGQHPMTENLQLQSNTQNSDMKNSFDELKLILDVSGVSIVQQELEFLSLQFQNIQGIISQVADCDTKKDCTFDTNQCLKCGDTLKINEQRQQDSDLVQQQIQKQPIMN